MASRHARFTIAALILCLAGGIAMGSAIAVAAGPQLPADATVPADADAAANADVIHVLNRLGYGPRPGDVARVRRMGIKAYIEQQLSPETVPDELMPRRLARFDTLSLSTRELWDTFFQPAMEMRRGGQAAGAPPATNRPEPGTAAAMAQRTPEQTQAVQAERQVLLNLQQQKILRAVYSERQLEEVMVDFWFNHFNVFAGKGVTRVYLTEHERDTIRPRVLGSFRDLLGEVARSPAMLFYLDNWQSAAPLPAAVPGGGRPAQNRRPSGLNENYARELMELHTLGVDSGYTQRDVQEIARAFTGWTIANPRQGGGFRFNPRMHDDGEKVVLGHRIKAWGGQADGEQVLDILASHPATAGFIATKLARRFVADNPSPALVARAAARFTSSGGNIRETVRAIVTSPEFLAADARRAKVKSPFEFVVSAVRATGAETANAVQLAQALRGLGMPPYGCQPPTGYADRAEAWVNTGALLGRMNFAVALTSGTLQAGRRGTAPAPRQRRAAERGATADQIVDDVLGGSLSAATRATVARASEPAQVIALLLGSPEFQKR